VFPKKNDRYLDLGSSSWRFVLDLQGLYGRLKNDRKPGEKTGNPGEKT
jgi:hypothetical protein